MRCTLSVERLELRETPAVNILFDYSYDSLGFFDDPTRREVMEAIGQQVGELLNDFLPAVSFNPALPQNTWSINFPNPSSTSQSVTIQNPTIPENTLIVYVGGANIDSAGLAGPGGLNVSGSPDWVDYVFTRGTPGANGTPATDYAPWGGTIRFNPSINWYFGLDPDGLNGSLTDFYTVATHELFHVLGFGVAEWQQFVSGETFIGPNAVSVFGGPVPVDVADAHWNLDPSVLGYAPIMNPYSLNGRRDLISKLDLAALVDVGWQINLAALPPTLPPASPALPVAPPTLPPTSPIPPAQVGNAGQGPIVSEFAVSTDRGATGNQLRTINGERFAQAPFAPQQGSRSVAADVTGDGITDLIVGAGPGGISTVIIFDGVTGNEVHRFDAFESSFLGGIFITAADINRDGYADLMISPDESGGPRVRVISGRDGSTLADFFGIDDPNFRGGARVAVSDLNGDQIPDLLVAAGFGGGPRVAGFSGTSLRPGSTPTKLFNDFFVFEASLRNGVFLTGGDLNGDGFGDLIVGGGPGGGPRVLGLSGRDLTQGNTVQIANFFAGSSASRGGVRVAMKDLDGDTFDDLVVGAGVGDVGTVMLYRGRDIPRDGTPPTLSQFTPFGDFRGGIFVG
ncbi:hypothetical protein [Tuwongella immobilis]|uniref:Calx-beta domain-containing protein: Calx-beta domain-containing protein n=1 Tax=Tuwongella immobilis TaxID=692036 RepID=A0A6C2YT17_9BACT|nr:hypothetical protein [Tuwongella immobilis]VIP04273.1 calx-beta domain-containing protein : Calx-beta domain-containing protein OS=Singulisphaera acidiphila (strain ATCC BAA-1392 / DSM 18658 / VKM B-2454 / MOB10) GN=Sinac_5612 PE=4 SV=1 [Tuwongella immobilis]VTS05909.1 calx-beta domain-containing protein : Calx-beta domain-containing protein OS=Singulisphaera acidiphila (strain ATCC BAA-1392 / DSM 18658 / VKM B-2454 / MOB10) GN=Sinac_5612 PE=4 SV=1 [Tuwongella immobilis]